MKATDKTKMPPTVMAWRLPDNSGVKNCVVIPIRSQRLQVITSNDTGVRMVSVSESELNYMEPLEYKERPYPIPRACGILLDSRLGCSVEASNKLNELIERYI